MKSLWASSWPAPARPPRRTAPPARAMMVFKLLLATVLASLASTIPGAAVQANGSIRADLLPFLGFPFPFLVVYQVRRKVTVVNKPEARAQAYRKLRRGELLVGVRTYESRNASTGEVIMEWVGVSPDRFSGATQLWAARFGPKGGEVLTPLGYLTGRLPLARVFEEALRGEEALTRYLPCREEDEAAACAARGAKVYAEVRRLMVAARMLPRAAANESLIWSELRSPGCREADEEACTAWSGCVWSVPTGRCTAAAPGPGAECFDFRGLRSGVEYFLYQPSGGLNNQRLQMENALVACMLLGRVCILPPLAPHTNYVRNYNEVSGSDVVSAARIFDLEALNRVVEVECVPNGISHAEFVERLEADVARVLASGGGGGGQKLWTKRVKSGSAKGPWNEVSLRNELGGGAAKKKTRPLLYFSGESMWKAFKFFGLTRRFEQRYKVLRHVTYHDDLKRARGLRPPRSFPHSPAAFPAPRVRA